LTSGIFHQIILSYVFGVVLAITVNDEALRNRSVALYRWLVALYLLAMKIHYSITINKWRSTQNV